MFILIKNKHNLSTFEEIRLAAGKFKKATEISAQKVKYGKTNPFASDYLTIPKQVVFSLPRSQKQPPGPVCFVLWG